MNQKVGLIIAGVLVVIVAIGMIASPSSVYHMAESWKSNYSDSGPSKAYITMTRIRGAVVLALGLVVLIGSFFI